MREIDEERQKLQQQRQEWEEIEAKARRVSQQAARNGKVKLNVGGTVFTTTVDTLTNEKPTFFSALFSEHFNTRHDADGEVFVDRSSTHFDLILNHLRGMDISKKLQKLSDDERSMLEQDVDYYAIESLAVLLGMKGKAAAGNDGDNTWTLDETKKHKDLSLTKNQDGSVTVKHNSVGSHAPVLGHTGFSSGVHEWKVRIDQVDQYH